MSKNRGGGNNKLKKKKPNRNRFFVGMASLRRVAKLSVGPRWQYLEVGGRRWG